jgi:3'-5' exoribonuclease
VYEQPIWRGALPTAQVEKKGPAPEALTPVIYVPRTDAAGRPQGTKRPKDKRRPEPRAHSAAETKPGDAPAAQARAAEGQEARPEGAPTPPRSEGRPDRPDRPDRPERGPREHRGFGGFGDKKRGYTGPRLPGDKGPHRPPEKKEKALTHNPFAALAQKLEEAGKSEPKPEETAPPADAPPGEASAPVEATPPPETRAPAEAAPETKAAE